MIFLDIEMKHTNGIEVAQKIRESDSPSFVIIPIGRSFTSSAEVIKSRNTVSISLYCIGFSM